LIRNPGRRCYAWLPRWKRNGSAATWHLFRPAAAASGSLRRRLRAGWLRSGGQAPANRIGSLGSWPTSATAPAVERPRRSPASSKITPVSLRASSPMPQRTHSAACPGGRRTGLAATSAIPPPLANVAAQGRTQAVTLDSAGRASARSWRRFIVPPVSMVERLSTGQSGRWRSG
jgi:hypothetical protein